MDDSGNVSELMANLETECTEPLKESCVADGPDDMTCAICLSQIQVTDIAYVKGCEHAYCVSCILEWTTHRENPWCPQCKTPFSYLMCYRQLDGTLSDYPVEESVVLLKRATWFQKHLKVERTQEDAAQAAAARPSHASQDWFGEFYDDFEDDNDPDAVEDYYFSSAAGNARIVLGNRRLGENGFMRAGRIYARPVPTASRPVAKSSKNPRIKVQREAPAFGSSPVAGSSPSSWGASPIQQATAGGTPGNCGSASKPGSGRRARRNARRAEVDGQHDCE